MTTIKKTTAQVARQLGVSGVLIRRIAKRMKIQKIGRNWLFSQNDIRKLSNRKRKTGRPKKGGKLEK